MEATFRNGQIVVGGNARQQFYDARGYGYPDEGNRIVLSPVETAHLLLREDLTAVVVDGDRLEAAGFIQYVDTDRFGQRLLTYVDLRERGFYVAPDRHGWQATPQSETDFVVYERGSDPQEGVIAHRVCVVGEREPLEVATMPAVIAVVDGDRSVTYFASSQDRPAGTVTAPEPAPAEAVLLHDRLLCWAPPTSLYETGFFGQPVLHREQAAQPVLQLSLLEGAYLVATDRLEVAGGIETITDRGRAIEGEQFDRRYQVYRTLREAGIAPRTGFKFGADFRTYETVDSPADLGHSQQLLRVCPEAAVLTPRELSLDVRLAEGVRKEFVYARVVDEDVRFTTVERISL